MSPVWKNLGPDGGRIEALAQSPSRPDRMYALPHRLGLFRSDDRGNSWSGVPSDLPLDTFYRALAVSPTDEDLLILVKDNSSEVLRSTDAGRTWRPHAVGRSWSRVNVLRFEPNDPNLVLLAVCGGASPGIRRSTDGGVSWSASTSAVGSPEAIAFDPEASGTVLIGSQDGIYRSTDGGQEWSLVNTEGNTSVSSVSFCRQDSRRVWAAASPDGVLRSDDGGLTFVAAAQQPACGPETCRTSRITAHPVDPDVVLAGLESTQSYDHPAGVELSRSTDGGASWSVVHSWNVYTWANQRLISELMFDSQRPDHAYLAVTSESGGTREGLFRTDDGGRSWALSMSGVGGLQVAGLGHDAIGSIWVRVRNSRGLYHAASWRGPWTERDTPGLSPPTVFHVDARAPGVLQEAGSYCFRDACKPWHQRSQDGGSTWTRTYILGVGSWDTFPELIVTSGGGPIFYVWVDSDNGPSVERTDDGATYEVFNPGFLAAAAVLDPADPLRQFAVDSASPGTVRLTTDGGVTWALRSSGLPADEGVELLMDSGNPRRLVVVYKTAGTWGTIDEGITWRSIPSGTAASAVVAADWDPLTDRLFLATQDDGVWATGLGWTNEGLFTRDLTHLDFLPDEDALVLGTDHAGVFALPLSLPVSPSEMLTKLAASVTSLGLPAGFERSLLAKLNAARRAVDRGSVRAACGQLTAFVHHVDAQRGRHIGDEGADALIEAAECVIALLASSDGLFSDHGERRHAPGTSDDISGELRLSTYHATGFQASTTVRYELPRPSSVDLAVFDIRGRRVRNLENGATPAGEHVVLWDGRDGSGARVAAGVYFVRLAAGGHIRTGKVVLLGGR